jgi:hypothetical protein
LSIGLCSCVFGAADYSKPRIPSGMRTYSTAQTVKRRLLEMGFNEHFSIVIGDITQVSLAKGTPRAHPSPLQPKSRIRNDEE